MKRMYANEELVKLIQENAPETEVDDALSNTSENPVQNKVIYGALEDKQDALPDIAGETGKFLQVGSDGLEWANGASPLYNHVITGHLATGDTRYCFNIVTSSSSPFTNTANVCNNYLIPNGFTSIEKVYPASGYYRGTGDDPDYGIIYGIYGESSFSFVALVYYSLKTNTKVSKNINESFSLGTSEFVYLVQ